MVCLMFDSEQAANPGCVLENFVRWHSPPDWTEDSDGEANVAADAEDSSSRRGRLSRRMRKEGAFIVPDFLFL